MAEKDRKPGSPEIAEAAEPESAPVEGAQPALVIAADVEAALRGFTFPGTAKDLVERARQNGADESVVMRLAELPDRRFTSLGDALRQLDMLS